MPEFHFPNPSQLCAHGNPIVGCLLCAEEKKVRAEKVERKDMEKGAVKEKIDYSNPEHLSEILKYPNRQVDLANCQLNEFRAITFGTGSRFEERCGCTILEYV